MRARPSDADGLVTLGSALLQKARETGDASYYRRADQALAKALANDAANAGAYTTRGALRLARHDFRGALRDGLRARRLAPDVVKPFAVVVDANVELGRYAAAGKALQRMIDLKPNLDAYARVSYFRELHGDLRGAREALSLALAAGGEAPENAAYVQTLQGNLELARGRRGAAATAYRAALARVPGYVPARAGLARVDAAAGRLDSAIRRLRAVVARLPLPEYVVLLGETELAAGRGAAARRTFDLVRVQQRLLAGAGFDTDVELALFEADHGDRARGVTLARAAWRSAPSVRSADALGWALTRAGQPRQGLAWANPRVASGLTRRAVSLPRGHERPRGRPASDGRAPAAPRAERRRALLRAVRAQGAPGAERAVSRRSIFAALAAVLVMGLLLPAGANAHPLGNFTVNRLSVVSVSTDRVDVRWILDQAEIPTFQERGRSPAAVLTAKREQALRGLRLRVDGRAVALRALVARDGSPFPTVRAGCARRGSSCC